GLFASVWRVGLATLPNHDSDLRTVSLYIAKEKRNVKNNFQEKSAFEWAAVPSTLKRRRRGTSSPRRGKARGRTYALVVRNLGKGYKTSERRWCGTRFLMSPLTLHSRPSADQHFSPHVRFRGRSPRSRRIFQRLRLHKFQHPPYVRDERLSSANLVLMKKSQS